MEIDGHVAIPDGGGGAATSPTPTTYTETQAQDDRTTLYRESPRCARCVEYEVPLDVRPMGEREADRSGVSRPLLLSLLNQETKFWEGNLLGRMFLRPVEVPYSRYRDKAASLGIAHIKLDQAEQILRDEGEPVPDREELRSKLVYDDAFSVRLAATYLRQLKDQGHSDRGAFLAYAAGPETKRDLRADTDAVVNQRPVYAERDRAFSHYYFYYTALYRLRGDGMDEIDLSQEAVEAQAPTLYGP